MTEPVIRNRIFVKHVFIPTESDLTRDQWKQLFEDLNNEQQKIHVAKLLQIDMMKTLSKLDFANDVGTIIGVDSDELSVMIEFEKSKLGLSVLYYLHMQPTLGIIPIVGSSTGILKIEKLVVSYLPD